MKPAFWCKNLIALSMRHYFHCRLEVVKIVTLVNVWTSHWLTGRPAHFSWHLLESLVLRTKTCPLLCSARVVDMLTKIRARLYRASHVVSSRGNNIACYSAVKTETEGFQKRHFLGTKIHGVTYHKTEFKVTAF